MSAPLLFSPMTIRGVELKNRIVVPPMHQYSAIKGFPTDWHLMNAGKFAAGGAGLVVVESTKVERRGCGTVGDLGIWDDQFIEPLSRLVKFIKQQNSVAGIQLGHSGRKARASRPWEGDRPFQRTPDTGGWAGWGPEQSAKLAKILKTRGVDVIDCSSGGITDLAPILGKEIKYSYQVPLSEYVRRHADIMTMAVGLIIHGDQAEQILRDGQADLIAVGREILNNPNWPMDAALKLGVEGPFRNVPPQFGYWLGTRAKRGFGTPPSTWQNGLQKAD